MVRVCARDVDARLSTPPPWSRVVERQAGPRRGRRTRDTPSSQCRCRCRRCPSAQKRGLSSLPLRVYRTRVDFTFPHHKVDMRRFAFCVGHAGRFVYIQPLFFAFFLCLSFSFHCSCVLCPRLDFFASEDRRHAMRAHAPNTQHIHIHTLQTSNTPTQPPVSSRPLRFNTAFICHDVTIHLSYSCSCTVHRHKLQY